MYENTFYWDIKNWAQMLMWQKQFDFKETFFKLPYDPHLCNASMHWH